MKRYLLITVMIALIGVLIFSGCVAPAPAPAPVPAPAPAPKPAPSPAPQSIKIGIALPLTGPFASLGGEIREGHELAIEDINAAGGVYVKEFDKKIPLEVVLLDNESDAVKVVSRYESLYTRDNVVVFIGPSTSGLIAATAPVAERYGVPMLGIAFGLLNIHEQGYRFLFSPYWKSDDDSTIITHVSEAVPANARPTKMALWQIQDDWGIEQAKWDEQLGIKNDWKVVSRQTYTFGTQDFSSMILAAKQAGAESIFSTPTAGQAMQMMKQMKELNYSPKLVVFYRGPDNPAWAQAMGPDGNYVTGSRAWAARLKMPESEKVVRKSLAKYGREFGVNAGPQYASVQIIAQAIELAGTLDRGKIRDALATREFTTIMGPVKFDKNGTWENPGTVVTQWIKGSMEVVLPKKVASADFVYPMPAWDKR